MSRTVMVRRAGARAPAVQAKLEVGRVDDPAEAEADRMAAHVTGASDHRPKLGAEPRQTVQPSSDGGGGAPGGAAQAAQALTGPGRGLSTAEHAFHAPRFGTGFEDVRIHEGAEIDAAAQAIGARAFTLGNDIGIASGQYAQGTRDGQFLMAHELTHTLQQSGDRLRRWPDPEDLWNRGSRWAGRQWDRAGRWSGRQWDRAGRALDKAGQAAQDAADDAGKWWGRGSGSISKITFDGSQVKTHGSPSKSYPAVSGLKSRHKNAGGVDYTDPSHQAVPDKGPLPEGSYFLDPAEVQTAKTHGFASGPWGHYRTRLHETTMTAMSRKWSTARTGGFFLHKDGGNDGTAGCIGLDSHADNKAIHDLIKVNGQQIPVEVDYPAAAKTGTPKLRRMPVGPEGQHQSIRRDPGGKTNGKAEQHYLVAAGIRKIDADKAALKGKPFSKTYYADLARHLFGIALDANSRDYGKAFERLDQLQWGDLGAGLRKHYEKVVGTDSWNGWDKFRHFVFTAYLQYKSGGVLAPEIFTYGKEMWDEVEGWFGADPEGYSIPDIVADNLGEAFAEDMASRERTEQWEKVKRDARRAMRDPRAWRMY